MLLQQILFFRELGFPLNEIQGFMSNPGFNKIEALAMHKISLQKNLEKTEMLIKTINETIFHLKGEKKMNATNLYAGFHSKMDRAVEDYAIEMKQIYLENGLSQEDMDIMDKAIKTLKTWPFEEFQRVMASGDELLTEFVLAIEHGFTPDSPEIQALVSRHYEWSSLTNGVFSKNGYYIVFSQSISSPQAEKYYNKYHPELMTYLFAAIRCFSSTK